MYKLEIKFMSIRIAPSILKELRKKLDMDIALVASKLDVEEDVLVSWESEGVEVDIKTARKLSTIYKHPWTIFFLESIPHKKTLPEKFRALFDEGVGRYSDKLYSALHNAERLLLVAEEIDARKPDWDDLRGLANYTDDVASLSSRFREWLGISIEEQKEWRDKKLALSRWISALEGKGILICEVAFPMEDGRAFCLSDNVRVVITLNKEDSSAGKIFSLFHEMHHVLTIGVKYFELLNELVFEGHDKEEVDANAFAGRFLLPTSDLYSFPTYKEAKSRDGFIRKLAKDFSVSEQMVIRRLLDAGYMSRTEFKNRNATLIEEFRLHKEKEADKDFYLPKGYNLWQRNKIKRNSRGFTADVYNAYSRKEITYLEIGRYLDFKLKHIPIVESLLINSNV